MVEGVLSVRRISVGRGACIDFCFYGWFKGGIYMECGVLCYRICNQKCVIIVIEDTYKYTCTLFYEGSGL